MTDQVNNQTYHTGAHHTDAHHADAHHARVAPRRIPVGLEIAIALQAAMYLVPISIEWKALFTFASLLVFLALRIDSRFFIFAALLHLWLAPFLLFAGFTAYAEANTLYAFYYLAAGIICQLVEWLRPAPPDFTYFVRSTLTTGFWQYLVGVGALGIVLALVLRTGAMGIAIFLYIITIPMVLFAADWLAGVSDELPREADGTAVERTR